MTKPKKDKLVIDRGKRYVDVFVSMFEPRTTKQIALHINNKIGKQKTDTRYSQLRIVLMNVGLVKFEGTQQHKKNRYIIDYEKVIELIFEEIENNKPGEEWQMMNPEEKKQIIPDERKNMFEKIPKNKLKIISKEKNNKSLYDSFSGDGIEIGKNKAIKNSLSIYFSACNELINNISIRKLLIQYIRGVALDCIGNDKIMKGKGKSNAAYQIFRYICFQYYYNILINDTYIELVRKSLNTIRKDKKYST